MYISLVNVCSSHSHHNAAYSTLYSEQGPRSGFLFLRLSGLPWPQGATGPPLLPHPTYYPSKGFPLLCSLRQKKATERAPPPALHLGPDHRGAKGAKVPFFRGDRTGLISSKDLKYSSIQLNLLCKGLTSLKSQSVRGFAPLDPNKGRCTWTPTGSLKRTPWNPRRTC